MFNRLLAFLADAILRSPFRHIIWKRWYNYFANQFGDIGITLMNYGYAETESSLSSGLILESANEQEQYGLQLYHQAATRAGIAGKDVLEVGCGRGGGAAYMSRYLGPRSVTGIDLSDANIRLCQDQFCQDQLCQDQYTEPGLNFLVGDAQQLPFPDNTFDVIINIESSHCYPQLGQFFSEVVRLLRPQGTFVLADFRAKEEIAGVQALLAQAGLKTVQADNITANVLQALELDNARKLEIIHQRVPAALHPLAYGFAAVKESDTYAAFQNGDLEYFLYVLEAVEKAPAEQAAAASVVAV